MPYTICQGKSRFYGITDFKIINLQNNLHQPNIIHYVAIGMVTEPVKW